MKHLIKNRKKMAKYDVLEIDETKANLLAENGKPAFKCDYDSKYYTYDDIPVSGTPAQINDTQNDDMFIIEWNGTGPVLKTRKMFPR